MNSVQQKISCVYERGVVDEPSNKRPHQAYRVTATRDLCAKALEDDVTLARATEKLDGTCCRVAEFKGEPVLWARHDRKPSKAGERRFAQYKKTKAKFESEAKSGQTDFEWDPAKDFREVPENWIPAQGHSVKNGFVMPDGLGHTPGWVPVLPGSRQHCWHLEVVRPSLGMALILKQSEDCVSDLVIEVQPMSNLCGHTYELIGTNINGNPYNLGSKKFPFHVLVGHGSLDVPACPNPVDYDAFTSWITSGDTEANQLEGVVWHCGNGQMYKIHRHHLDMRWPDRKPVLCQRKVKVEVSLDGFKETDRGSKQAMDLFAVLASLNGKVFESLLALCNVFGDQ